MISVRLSIHIARCSKSSRLGYSSVRLYYRRSNVLFVTEKPDKYHAAFPIYSSLKHSCSLENIEFYVQAYRYTILSPGAGPLSG
jgi:hypothetical protein